MKLESISAGPTEREVRNGALADAKSSDRRRRWSTPRRLRRCLLPAAATVAILVTSSCDSGRSALEASGAEHPNVVLISLDTLRADALGRYGADRRKTPHIDAFFDEAVTFKRAYSPEPHTLPAHVTLFTSLHPISHGVKPKLSGSIGISSRIPTLASILSDSGYQTAAFVNGGFLDRRYGFDRGFDHYDFFSDIQTTPGNDHDDYGRSAAKTIQSVFDWVDESSREPVFLFLHFFDAHSDWRLLPYEADENVLAAYLGENAEGLEERWKEEPAVASTFLVGANQGKFDVDPATTEEIRALYDAGVHELDAAFGRLITGLEERNLFRDALVIVVADHGEEFREHGRFLHTQLYEESVKIPMAVRLPGPTTATGRQRTELVSLADVMPTILAFLRIDPPPGLQGRNLMELIDSAGDDPPEDWRERRLFFISRMSGVLAVNLYPWKLYYDSRNERYRLYDLVSDPAESNDLARSQPETVRAGALLLRGWLDAAPRPYEGDEEATVSLDDETVEQLNALGYGSD